MDPDIKKYILGTITDMVSNFLYYDRKEDENLPRGAVEEAVNSGLISVQEIIDKFTSELAAGLVLSDDT